MSLLVQNQTSEIESTEKQWKSIYTLGGGIALVVVLATIFDIIIGTTLGSDLSAVPKTAVDRFAQFQDNWLVGLYYLDFLNFSTAILMIPTYFALFAAHRRANTVYPMLGMIIYFIAAAVFITNNIALPMLELSYKFAASTIEAQRNLFAAAGEAMLARGGHGSMGAFPGFILSAVASVVMSYGMLKGRVFSRATAYAGILGGSLLSVYLVLVTFIPEMKGTAVMLAAPGGLLALAWTIMFTVRLFQLGRSES